MQKRVLIILSVAPLYDMLRTWYANKFTTATTAEHAVLQYQFFYNKVDFTPFINFLLDNVFNKDTYLVGNADHVYLKDSSNMATGVAKDLLMTSGFTPEEADFIFSVCFDWCVNLYNSLPFRNFDFNQFTNIRAMFIPEKMSINVILEYNDLNVATGLLNPYFSHLNSEQYNVVCRPTKYLDANSPYLTYSENGEMSFVTKPLSWGLA